MLNENTQSSLPEWWIKFAQHDGKIFQISPREIRLSDSDSQRGFAVIKTTNELCKKVTTNKIGIRRVLMLADPINGEFSIAEKSRKLDLTSESSIDSVNQCQIVKLPIRTSSDAAVSVTLHCNANTVSIEISEAIIRRKLGLAEIHEVASDGNERVMDLYLSQANNPDRLEHTVKVNIAELFRTGRFKAYLPEHLDLKKLSVWTVKVLGEYDLAVVSDLIEPDAVLRPYANVQRVFNNGKPAHVTITKTPNGVVLKSTISDHNKYQAIVNKRLHFVVSSSTIDNIVGVFSVNTNDLLNQQQTAPIEIEFDWPEHPVIAYKNRYLVVNYQGEANG